MDRRETMPMLGSSYYMQRPMPEFNGQQGIGQLSNSMAPFQPDVGAQSSGPELFHAPMSSIPAEANAGGGSSGGQSSGIPLRKKRGRPRKYGHGAAVSYPHPTSSPTVRELNTNPTTDTALPSKRGRGRPPGTGRKQQQDASDHGGNWMPSLTGAGFTPHVIAIAAGEDIVEKLLTFSRQGRRSVCLMAVSGTVSSVTLIQISSGATVTYEGRFDILHMSGSFLPRANDDHLNRTEGLTISLTSPDGRVFGGVVTGVLLAASPVQANSASGMAIEDSCKLKFRELKSKRNYRFIVFKIEEKLQQVSVEKLGGPGETYDDLHNSLPDDDCRYAVYDYDFTTAENCQKSKIFFISWVPDVSKVRTKMVYASSKERFRRELDGIQFELQATDRSEMSIDIVQERAK